MNTLLQLKNLACYEQNEFLPFEFDSKLPETYSIVSIVSLLKKFVEVKNSKECNLVKYDIS